MTSKERMLTALSRGKPDRLPVTIHQWQPYHLNHFMDGVDQIAAFERVGLDASVTPTDIYVPIESSDWRINSEPVTGGEDEMRTRHRVTTPKGELTWTTAANEYTTFNVEYPVKDERDADILLKYWPGITLNHKRLCNWYDRTGDKGIVRGFVSSSAQPGSWQEFCELIGTQEAIMYAIDNPAFVHYFLDKMTQKKVDYIFRELPGVKFDLIEHGGGAASSTVISPSMFDEFCVPYDRKVIAALHEVGLRTVYHTCGGMTAILDRISANGTDASETLSPPGVGGDIRPEDRDRVKTVLGSEVALIGGLDQSNLLTDGSKEQIAAEVKSLFETFGAGGGYICSACDHFFHAPVENLLEFAAAGRQCIYG